MQVQSTSDPALDYFAVTPNDAADLAKVTRALIIQTAGNLKVTKADGTQATLTLPAGIFPAKVIRVWATGTTASGITALV